MLNKKVMVAAFAVLIMMAVPFAAVFAEDADAEGSATYGNYSIYTYDGTSWANETVTQAYDAADAVTKTTLWTESCEMTAKSEFVNGYANYHPETYGDIQTFRGLSEVSPNVWNIFVKVGNTWKAAEPSLGCYTCYDDYDVDFVTANICLFYGPAATAVPSDLANQFASTPLSSLTTPDTSAMYTYSFYLKIMPCSNPDVSVVPTISDSLDSTINAFKLKKGTTITGYGSNAAIALKDALKTNASIVMTVPGNYVDTANPPYYIYQGWVNSLFGLSTTQTAGSETPNDFTDDEYFYWNVFDSHSTMNDSSNHYADYVFGAYSDLSSGEFKVNNFSVIFQAYSFT